MKFHRELKTATRPVITNGEVEDEEENEDDWSSYVGRGVLENHLNGK